jgi:hypothetical protein
MILPGVYINVHPEGLIAPGQITIGNLGVVGTAAKGAIDTPILLGSFDDAKNEFYTYDPWLNASNKPNPNALTLVRALEQAFALGATTVYAVRVSTKDATGIPTAASATLTLKTQGGVETIVLTANPPGTDPQPGTWGNHMTVDVQMPTNPPLQAFIDGEIVPTAAPKLKRPVDKASARNRITVDNNGVVTTPTVVYDKAPKAGEVEIVTGNSPGAGVLHFFATETPKFPAVVTASYLAMGSAQQVTISLGRASEVYVVHDAADLVSHLVNESAWIAGTVNTVTTTSTPPNNASVKSLATVAGAAFAGGTDGATAADYQSGLDQLLSVDAHIIVAAGQDDKAIGSKLEAHCAKASTDALKRDRIAIVGSGLIDTAHPDNPGQSSVDTFFDKLIGHSLLSDRVIFAAPGIHAIDTAANQEVTLPGSYAAAALAGLISSFDPEVSPTNKELAVDELEYHFDAAHLTQMVQNRVLALESRSGFRIVKGITTDPGAFRQITTRRIVDYAKYGIRAAAEPYIGLLNNERVRGALRGTINSFLTDMVNAEMLEAYGLDVSATRDEEIQGIARVTISLQPVFSIDFIVVDIFLG